MSQAITLANIQKPFKKSEWPEKIVCKRCKAEKEAKEFVKDIELQTGRKNRCRACDREVRIELEQSKKPSSDEFFNF
jgi:hypothetical protein